MNDGIAILAREIDRERIRRARATPEAQKFLAGGDLFDAVRERMIAGIRFDFPHFTDAEVQAEFERRLAIAHRAEGMG